MVHEKEIQHVEETSQVKLRITVKKEDVKAEYDKLLQNYAKTARIDGFRKGKVPPSVLEREVRGRHQGGSRAKYHRSCFERSLLADRGRNPLQLTFPNWKKGPT